MWWGAITQSARCVAAGFYPLYFVLVVALCRAQVWTFGDHFREPSVGQNWTALPQWFKDHGYFTHGS